MYVSTYVEESAISDLPVSHSGSSLRYMTHGSWHMHILPVLRWNFSALKGKELHVFSF